MKRIYLLIPICLVLMLTGCEKKYTTVKDDITAAGEATEYITVDSFTLKEPAKEETEAMESCAVLIPAGFKRSDSVEGMYVSEMYPIESSNIFYTTKRLLREHSNHSVNMWISLLIHLNRVRCREFRVTRSVLITMRASSM